MVSIIPNPLSFYSSEKNIWEWLEKAPNYTRKIEEDDVTDPEKRLAIFALTVRACITIDERVKRKDLQGIKEWTLINIKNALPLLEDYVNNKNSVLNTEKSKTLLVVTANRVKSILLGTFFINQTPDQELARDLSDILEIIRHNFCITKRWELTQELRQKWVLLDAVKNCLEISEKVHTINITRLRNDVECLFDEITTTADEAAFLKESKRLATEVMMRKEEHTENSEVSRFEVVRNNIANADNAPYIQKQPPSLKLRQSIDEFVGIVMDFGNFDSDKVNILLSIGPKIDSPNPPTAVDLRICQDMADILLQFFEKQTYKPKNLIQICQKVYDSIDELCDENIEP